MAEIAAKLAHMHGVFCEGREIVNRRFIRWFLLTILQRQRVRSLQCRSVRNLALPVK